MRIGPIRHFLVAVLLVLGIGGSSRANLITNASFEFGGNTPDRISATIPGGSSDLTGWTAPNANVDWVRNEFWQSGNAPRSLDMTSLTMGGLSQTVATTPGTDYTLSFSTLINPDRRYFATHFLDVTVTDVDSGTDLARNLYGLGYGTQTAADMQWEFQAINFTATGTLTRFGFLTDPAFSDSGRTAVDNVTLTSGSVSGPVPAPPAVVLAGIGLGLCALRRRIRGFRLSV
ncbi:MAG TPA: DUF642 domain-containing protein [Fimbriiglobus sp.]